MWEKFTRYLLKQILFTSFICINIYASPLKPHAVYDFSKGLDTYHSSLSLPDGFVHNSDNVLFDAVAPVAKRKGFTVAFSSTASAGQTAWTYTDSTNTSWIIERTSAAIIANNLSGSASVLIATVSANNLVGEVNALGNAYFVDQTLGVYYWNGSTTTYVTGSPKGSLIAQFHGRVWVAGLAVPNGNLLYGSKQYDGTVWTTGLNPNDPVILTVGLQDNFDSISALYPYLDTFYVFKHFLTYAIYGFDQTSFQISFITSECGCIDQQSIQTFGASLKFMSERGVENFDGYTCTRISDPVKNLVDPAIQSQGGSNTQSWLQQSAADWNQSTTVSVDTTSVPGAVAPYVYDQFSSLSNWNATTSTCTWFLGANVTYPGLGTEPPGGRCYMSSKIALQSASFFLHYQFQFTPYSGGIQIAGISYLNPSGDGYCISADSLRVTGGVVFGTLGSPNLCQSVVSVSTSTLAGSGIHSMDLVGSSTGFFQFYLDGVFMGSFTNTFASGMNHMELGGQISMASSDGFQIGNAYVGASTASLKSQIHSVGSITSWGNFSVQDSLGGGAIAFSICSSTNSNMSAPASCASQTPNAQITISTGSFVQWYSTFTITAATQTPTLNSVTVQWFSGGRSAPMSSTVWDNRYMLSLTTSTSDSANDAILVLSTKGSWALYDIHAGGLVQYKNNLYHTDSAATGNVNLDNQGYNDNGVAINAFIQTKDYCEEGPPQDDYYESLYPTMDNLGNYNMAISYQMDRDPTVYSLSSINQTEFSNNSSIKIPFIQSPNNQNFGKCINYTFSESDPSSPWSFYGFTSYFHERAVQ